MSKIHRLMIVYIILYLAFTLSYHQKTGYWGFKDCVNYQDHFEEMRYSISHWMIMALLGSFGFIIVPIGLSCIFIPYALFKYLKDEEKTVNFLLYSPFIFYAVYVNLYSQLLFFFFYLMYLGTKERKYMIMSFFTHPIFSAIYIIDALDRLNIRNIGLMLVLSALLAPVVIYYLSDPSYSIFREINGDELDLISTLIYINPLILPLKNRRNIATFLISWLGHNGRFKMFYNLQQYEGKTGSLGLYFGLCVNLVLVCGLLAHLYS